MHDGHAGEATVDSGAAVRMMKNDRIIASSRKKVSTDINTAGNTSVKANLDGRAKVLMIGGANSVDMSRVLSVPYLRDNLLSVGGLCDVAHTVIFTNIECTVLNGTTIVGRGERKGVVYVFGIMG